jgi:hypothetical protein
MWIKICLLVCLIPLPAFAQRTSKTSATRARRAGRAVPPNQLHFRLGGVIWQENLKVRNDTSQGNMETQSQGIVSSFAYMIPTGGRTWLQTYSFDFGFGAIKGKGRSAAIPDELKGQLWLMGGFSPGLLYRTSPISAVGLMLPFSYRLIEWKLKDGSSFNPEGDSSFSVGLSGVYINQLTKNNYLYLSITHQTNWAANIWNLSWQYKFF